MKPLTLAALLSAVYINVHAQTITVINADTLSDPGTKKAAPVTLPAGTQYSASAWKTLWWGKHYRKEWATPVQFEVLDLSSVDGGLTPIKTGGGHQTKTLRMLSRNGREYILRTIDKSLDVLVPDELKGTRINDLVNDQISTAHPYGSLAIAHLAGSVSLFHANPTIYFVPDDPVLGEFRSIFANRLCLLEERPSGKGWEGSPLFGYPDDIVNTEKMMNDVFKNTKNTVDQQTFLRARLFDMLINDWDRHEDQWVWVVKKEASRNLFIPIPRDRDQAFSKTDGIALYFLSRRWALRALQNMDPTVKDLRGANFAARNLDQQFLNNLPQDTWRQTISFIQAKLSDSLIESAVAIMPPEVNSQSGTFLVKRLKERRENMSDYGMHYYSILSKKITIAGSAAEEKFFLNVDGKDRVTVTGLRASNDTFFHRVFNRHETKQINIYALDGNDEYTVTGNGKNKFIVRFIGGNGNNQYKSELPKASGKRVTIYDSLLASGSGVDGFRVKRRWDSLYRYNRASVKYDWFMPLIFPGYNQDDGFNLGLGFTYIKQKWGKWPFGYQQTFLIDYAAGTGAVGFNYKGLFKQTFGRWDLDIYSFYKGPRYTFNYYGLGNEVTLGNFSQSYYRVKANNLYVNPGVSRTFNFSTLRFGLRYESVEILHDENKFAGTPDAKLEDDVFSLKHFAGPDAEWNFLKIDDLRYPRRGVHLQAALNVVGNLSDMDRQLLTTGGSLVFYHTFFGRLTLAHRTGAATSFGEYEFYQANTLGGHRNLRGYWRNRFAGRTSFYQNTEFRLAIADLKGYTLRGKFGITAFLDDGRVWIEDETSSKLHIGYGGGIFFMPFRFNTFNVYYSASNEASMITVKVGFFLQ